MRTLLLAPADDPDAVEAALAAGPDGVILSGGPARSRHPSRGVTRLIQEVGPFDSVDVEAQVEAGLAWRPDAVLLRGAAGARDVQRLGAMLAVAEANHDLPDGGTRIVASACDTAGGALAAASLPGSSPRLDGVLWDGGLLAEALGCDPDAVPVVHSRGLAVLAASAAGVPAYAVLGRIDPGADAITARRDGFAGLACRDPARLKAARRALGGERLRPGSAA